MCGRYSLGVRLAFVRHQLQQQGQRVDEAPNDEDVRETYNFAPGNYGAVYRPDTPDHGAYAPSEAHDGEHHGAGGDEHDGETQEMNEPGDEHIKYKLQSMKWGLVPSWTKRSPGYGSLMKTINCRDDSLAENRGMWTPMKKRKRCVVVCQGFYEWLKKGKEKIPHFIRRKDGNLMCFAGLWDCVQYEGSGEKLYTYTVITTSSNDDVRFIHDRMPVILEPGSPEMAAWLDPHRTTWTEELQSMLKPYEGELEIYAVSKEVGKVGNNSPDFIVPVNSKENKKNIANFFANTQNPKAQISSSDPEKVAAEIDKLERESKRAVKHEAETDAVYKASEKESLGVKREREPDEHENEDFKPSKFRKTSQSPTKPVASPVSAKMTAHPGRKTRSATRNVIGTTKAKGAADAKKPTRGSQRITSFFGK